MDLNLAGFRKIAQDPVKRDELLSILLQAREEALKDGKIRDRILKNGVAESYSALEDPDVRPGATLPDRCRRASGERPYAKEAHDEKPDEGHEDHRARPGTAPAVGGLNDPVDEGPYHAGTNAANDDAHDAKENEADADATASDDPEEDAASGRVRSAKVKSVPAKSRLIRVTWG
jgi:hypothetical protein